MPCVAGGRHSDDRHPPQELVYDVTRRVPRNAGLAIDDIDGVVVASGGRHDGRAISVATVSGPVGGADRAILSTPSAGEHASVMGAPRVVCGRYRTQLVVAWSPTEAGSLPGMRWPAADPYFRRGLTLDEVGAHVLRANVPPAAAPGVQGLARRAAEENRRNGVVAHPEAASGASAPAADEPRWP